MMARPWGFCSLRSRPLAGGKGGDLEVGLLAKQLLEDNQGEVDVQDDAVVDGQAQQHACQQEVLLAVQADVVEPEGARFIVPLEHAVRLHTHACMLRTPRSRGMELRCLVPLTAAALRKLAVGCGGLMVVGPGPHTA